VETLRSLRHVIARIRKPGSARRAPVAMAIRVVATSGVLISALALVGAGAAEAATGGHAATRTHAVSRTHAATRTRAASRNHGTSRSGPGAQSVAVGPRAKANGGGTKQCRASRPAPSRRGPGPWLYVASARGPWLFTTNTADAASAAGATRGPWLFIASATRGPWLFADPVCAAGASRG
jgi:hypothetical protein